MVDALLLLWGMLHTLEDPVVIVACAAVGGACGAFARRLDRATWASGVVAVVGHCAIGGVLTGITSAAAAFVGMELFPKWPKLVVGAVLFVSGVVDTTTDAGQSWVQREVFGRLLALFDAARNGGRYVPPPQPPAGPVIPPAAPIVSQVLPTPNEQGKVEPGGNSPQPKKKGPW